MFILRLFCMLTAYIFSVAVLPSSIAHAAVPIPGLNFNGVGNGFQSYVPAHSTSDSTGAVGDTQYVQAVNTSYAVFNKTNAALLQGPLPLSNLFAGFGGACEANSELQTDIIKHADPIVLYDRLADRWFITFFAWDESFQGDPSGQNYHYWQCMAVSQTSDATGAYHRYAFETPMFDDGSGSNLHHSKNDYGKFGVWPDAYYAHYYMEAPEESYIGSEGGMVCAYEREAMLNGDPAQEVCFHYQTPGMEWIYNYNHMLPADLDGDTPPPAGSPNYFMGYTVNPTSTLHLFEFHVDWANTANSTFTGPVVLPVNTYKGPCATLGSRNCIPQLGTTTKLDALGPRPMNRMAYRNFGTHESLVLNQSVETTFGTAKSAGVRWYEIRNPGGTPTVRQQATYAPNSTARWMGSAAMDKMGNIAIGYSMSSATINPRIAYANRLAGDPLNTMSNETILHSGTGSKIGNRWGDYTHMSIDPVDDCTFWYTNQYMQTTGSRWSTRIGSFRLPGCQ